jgi:hypothetical protein
MAYLLRVDSSEPPADTVSQETATAADSASAFVDARLISAEPRTETSQRRHVPAHRSGRLSRGRHAPGLHRRQDDPDKAVARLFKVVRSLA